MGVHILIMVMITICSVVVPERIDPLIVGVDLGLGTHPMFGVVIKVFV